MTNLPVVEASYWRESYPHTGAQYPILTENIAVDVVIVGAGITGLTTAYLLKQAGLTVVVLDKDTVGGGTTGRTTGKVTSQHNIIYHDLQARLGAATARTYGEANQAAIEQIEQNIKSIHVDCDWQRDDNYVFTTDDRNRGLFKQEARAAAALGLPASFETSSSLPFDIRAGQNERPEIHPWSGGCSGRKWQFRP